MWRAFRLQAFMGSSDFGVGLQGFTSSLGCKGSGVFEHSCFRGFEGLRLGALGV